MATPDSASNQKLESKINTQIQKAMKAEIFEPFTYRFRASRLPFCPRELVIDRRWPKGQALRSESYDFQFYVKIGTAIHEVVQQYLGMADALYGHWTCCGVTELFREGSALCPVCGRPQMYEEFEVDNVLGMHVDSVFLRYLTVGEYKSTGSHNLPLLEGPYPQHHEQASVYLDALNQEYGWGLKKIAFVYFSRDRPSDYRIFIVDPLENALQLVVDRYEKTLAELASGVVPDGICENTYEGHRRGCAYYGVCFHPNLEQNLIPVESLSR